MSQTKAYIKEKQEIVFLAVLIITGGMLPLFLNPYALRALSVYWIYVLLGAGLSIVVIYAGLLDLGYIAFFAVGAYTYALLDQFAGVSFWLALPIGSALAALLGILLGFPTLRVRGDYLALVTLGFGEIVHVLLVNIWGPHGFSGIRPPISAQMVGNYGVYLVFYYVSFLLVPMVFFLISQLNRAWISRPWFALRDNEVAARSCGIGATRWLLLAFAFGTSFAGLAGVVFAGIQRYVSPSTFVLDESILVLSIVVIAGSKSRLRLLIAAAVLCLIPEFLRETARFRMLLFGCVLIGFVIGDEWWQKWSMRRSNIVKESKKIKPAQTSEDALCPSAPAFLRKEHLPHWNICAQNLVRDFDGVRAIDGVSFELEIGGRICGLIGPNGAGKTTLFNCICGEDRPNSGSLQFPGSSRATSAHSRAKIGIARTFQIPQIFSTMTVQENITIGVMARSHIPFIKGIIGTPAWRQFVHQESSQVSDILAFLGLSEARNECVAALPLGLQRLTELGRALATQPQIILLDENASGMNYGEKSRMAELIKLLTIETGIGFFVVEHDMDFVMNLVEELLVMDAGRLIFQGSPHSAKKDKTVIEAYLGTTNYEFA